jgi:ribonuclease-3
MEKVFRYNQLIMQDQKALENKLNIKFKDKNLLSLSLIHKSFSISSNNEKLEFLGDRVLALILSEKLLNLYPHESEGNLDKKFASLVNWKICLKISKILKLEKFLVLGNTYKKKTKIEDKILSDACESLIGAIYLDSGYRVAKNFILKFWKDEINKSAITEKDSKTKLQEYSLKHFRKLPTYRAITYKGPRHKPLYKASVKIYNSKFFYGVGNSKKVAEHDAAKKLLTDLKI